MEKPENLNTPAVRYLKTKKIDFKSHLYPYEEHGGTRHAAEVLNIPEHAVIKTLVMESEAGRPFIVLEHGDYQVSTKQLARILGVKRIIPCVEEKTQKQTGYQVGGISPFGTRKSMPIYVEKSILTLDTLYINGGKRGFLIEITPDDLVQALTLEKVEAKIKQ
ncbi:MAG: Cys-tRNA(Pro) deacylase [Deltaproteobacteria bacterium]|nr:Cys-tRNA(Pro) deacylase [Deltaproteobacteria bacterium]